MKSRTVPYFSFLSMVYSFLIPGICFLSLDLQGQGIKNYFDGPYINEVEDSLQIKWVENGYPKDTMILTKNATTFDRPGLPIVQLQDLEVTPEDSWEYPTVKKFVALSDLHGQYDIFINLLKNHKIIDSTYQWSFGTNHLVITGDHFSRGDKVMEILWFLFALEKQAAKAGGKVHVLLGNHELMTLQNDLRYLNVKYAYTAGALRTMYPELFGNKSVLGKWLRTKNVIISINDNLCLHAGISQQLVDSKLTLQQINDIVRDSILSLTGKEIAESPNVSLITGDLGPFWYRGNADTLTFSKDSLERFLEYFNVERMIVGHTSMDQIYSVYDGKMFLIDCSIKLGETGQLLLYQKGQFFRGTIDGKKISLSSETDVENEEKNTNKSLFEMIYDVSKKSNDATITLQCDIKHIVRQSIKEELHEGSFTLGANGDVVDLNLNVQIRSRGNMRKQVCRIPPLKINFKKKDLKKLGLSNSDKLKLVLPCDKGNFNQQKLFQEYLAYELYNIIDPDHVRATKINIVINNDKKENEYAFTALMIEDEEAFAIRTGAQILGGTGKIVSAGLNKISFVRMYLFQYMIGNTDWSIANRHNVMLAKLPHNDRLTALPYDFDYSGLVDQKYAVPYESLPIKNVSERYLMPYEVSENEVDQVLKEFNDLELKIMAICDDAAYLDESVRKNVKKYLSEFFKEIKNPEKFKKKLNIK